MNEIQIPENLEECFDELNNMLKPEDVEDIKNRAIEVHWLHMGLGMWLRNNWGLWHGSKLRDWFNAKDIYHADDMSGIIIESYQRRLNNKALEVDKQIKYYQDYWEENGHDVKKEFLENEARIQAEKASKTT